MHDGFVRLVLEVAVPSASEFWTRPFIHHGQFLFCGSDLNSCIDTVGSQGSSAFDVPLVENSLLGLRIASNEVVEGLGSRLSTEYGEREIMILKVPDHQDVSLTCQKDMIVLVSWFMCREYWEDFRKGQLTRQLQGGRQHI